MSHPRGQVAAGGWAVPTTSSAIQQKQLQNIAVSPEYDPALASQLRRLFHQRVDVFAPIKPTRESILFGVVKIGLKVSSIERGLLSGLRIL